VRPRAKGTIGSRIPRYRMRNRLVSGHQSRDHLLPYRPFPIGGPLELIASISNGFRDIQRRMLSNYWLT